MLTWLPGLLQGDTSAKARAEDIKRAVRTAMRSPSEPATSVSQADSVLQICWLISLSASVRLAQHCEADMHHTVSARTAALAMPVRIGPALRQLNKAPPSQVALHRHRVTPLGAQP